MTGTLLELIGRSSSHFTRVARIFAFELEVPLAFRPLLDITSLDAGSYAGNPALKIPILVDERGPLFGAENICRDLLRRSFQDRPRVTLRGDLPERIVANAEELTLHAMSAEVSLIMAKVSGEGHLAPPKVSESLQRSLRYLDDNLESLLAALPEHRTLSFVEVALFCLATHLVFREVMDLAGFPHLGRFCARFGERASARASQYHFDMPR